MAKILPPSFFDRPVVSVARDLVGCILARRMPDGTVMRSMITETEAYDGEQDLACHARTGQTKRNAVMYGGAGHWYVYFTYGMHWMLNIVTGRKGYPAAVLIRGTEVVSGPGRLTRAFRIDRDLYGKNSSRKSGLWIEERTAESARKIRGCIVKTPRIGIDYAGPIWTAKEYRFVLKKI